MVTFSVDSQAVEDALLAFPEELEEAIEREAVLPYLYAVQSTARSQHRFRSKSGALERSVQVEVNSEGGSVYIEEGIAPHGKYIHEGFKTWSPDTFLTDAASANEGMLDAVLDRATDNAIKKVGL